MCWTLLAEEPHRPIILNLEHRPLKANVSCLIFPLHQGKMSSVQPLSGLDSPSQGSREQLTGTPPYHSPPSLSPFTIGKATRAHPALALFSPHVVCTRTSGFSATGRCGGKAVPSSAMRHIFRKRHATASEVRRSQIHNDNGT